MKCGCLNKDGTSSDICFGTCHSIIDDENVVPIENRIEIKLENFLSKLSVYCNQLENFSVIIKTGMDAKYKEGFRDGFYFANAHKDGFFD